jgi:putative addiction module CopG family antidote
MGTMNISLPDQLKSFVDEQVKERGYGTSSEYVRDLIVAIRSVRACAASYWMALRQSLPPMQTRSTSPVYVNESLAALSGEAPIKDYPYLVF